MDTFKYITCRPNYESDNDISEIQTLSIDDFCSCLDCEWDYNENDFTTNSTLSTENGVNLVINLKLLKTASMNSESFYDCKQCMSFETQDDEKSVLNWPTSSSALDSSSSISINHNQFSCNSILKPYFKNKIAQIIQDSKSKQMSNNSQNCTKNTNNFNRTMSWQLLNRISRPLSAYELRYLKSEFSYYLMSDSIFSEPIFSGRPKRKRKANLSQESLRLPKPSFKETHFNYRIIRRGKYLRNLFANSCCLVASSSTLVCSENDFQTDNKRKCFANAGSPTRKTRYKFGDGEIESQNRKDFVKKLQFNRPGNITYLQGDTTNNSRFKETKNVYLQNSIESDQFIYGDRCIQFDDTKSDCKEEVNLSFTGNNLRTMNIDMNILIDPTQDGSLDTRNKNSTKKKLEVLYSPRSRTRSFLNHEQHVSNMNDLGKNNSKVLLDDSPDFKEYFKKHHEYEDHKDSLLDISLSTSRESISCEKIPLDSVEFKERVVRELKRFLNDNMLISNFKSDDYDVYIIPRENSDTNSIDNIHDFTEDSSSICDPICRHFSVGDNYDDLEQIPRINCCKKKRKLNNQSTENIFDDSSESLLDILSDKDYDNNKKIYEMTSSLPFINTPNFYSVRNGIAFRSRSADKVDRFSSSFRNQLSNILLDQIKTQDLHRKYSNLFEFHSFENFKFTPYNKVTMDERKPIAPAKTKCDILEELNKFKKVLSEVEYKHNSLIQLLNRDPCGLSFAFPKDINSDT